MEKQFWIDFVEGKISIEEMLCKIKKNKNLVNWFNKIVSPEEKMLIAKEKVFEGDVNISQYEQVDFELERFIQNELNFKNTRLAKQLNIFSTIADIVIKAFPNDKINVDNTLNNKFSFMLDACPEYIGGAEADVIVEKFLETNPNISKKQFKEDIKKMFNVEKCKYPRWVQSPEWPISKKGKPMKFVKQITDKSTQITKFIFEDIDTRKETIVEQYT